MADYVYRVFDPKVDEIDVVHKNGETIKELAGNYDFACNFSYANTVKGVPIGRLIVGGKTVMHDIDKTTNRDELYMLPDRTLHIGKHPNPVWAIQGSPPLLKGGKDVVEAGIKRDRTGTDIYTRPAIRTAAGITAAGKLVIVRTYKAMMLKELAKLMLSLGCVEALNGDGGGSSYLYPIDDGFGRKLGAALVIKKGVEKPVTKPVLVIDPGHGGDDPGASGNGIVEKDYTLKISLYQYERFKELGVPVALTRAIDKTLDSDTRTEMVRESGAKYCISNHINAAGADAQGVETIHSIHSDGKLANALAKAVVEAGQPFRRVFFREHNGADYYFMHRETGSVSTVIVEYGFCTNAADAARIKSNWQVYAEAVVRAFCSFAGFTYKPREAAPVVEKTDYAGHWAEKAIKTAIDAKIMLGDGKGNFSPDKPVSRAEMAVIIERLLKRKEV
jgi:N-acetylmuramoyl-L-alanine amidase